MTTLFIVNHPPYGTEHAFNAVRLANAMAGREDQIVRVFLQGDAALCAKAGQQVPTGYYNLERMLRISRAKGVEVGVCSICMDARGIRDEELSEGLARATLDDLAHWTIAADKVLVF
jgi:uncharacterized protein involved in oxidation of intracellular sulfur